MEQSNTSRLWKECEQAFLSATNRYHGSIEAQSGKLTFSAKNRFKIGYNDEHGWHGTEKTVPTFIEIEDHGNRVSMNCEEKSCEIAGGCYTAVETLSAFLNQLGKMLRRWNFKERKETYEQMTLF